MSKELEKEYLTDLDHYDEGMGIHSTSYQKCKERLIRLARIDSANPSEALETLKDMLIGNGVNDNINDYVDNLILPVKQALHRLEAIDNANFSEALECLEDIYRNGVFIREVSFEKQHPTNISPETNKSIDVQCDIIKQALLKAQEPKKYLKWEDLEFKKEIQEMKVLLNGETYVLDYKFYTCEHNVIHLSTLEYDRVLTCCGDYDFDIQFFNDLHLERVEE